MALEPVDDADLKDYGYAPGSYMIMCLVSNHQTLDCDKRATCCRDCATLRYRTNEQKRQEFSSRIQVDVRGALAKRQTQIRGEG